MTKTKEISAADIAKSLGVAPRIARVKLRAAGIRAPYSAKDVAKMKAIIKAPLPDKPKQDTAKPKRSKEQAAP